VGKHRGGDSDVATRRPARAEANHITPTFSALAGTVGQPLSPLKGTYDVWTTHTGFGAPERRFRRCSSFLASCSSRAATSSAFS
jgi:hypothetical protein